MQMRSGGPAGMSHSGDSQAGHDVVALLYCQLAGVAIEGAEPTAVIDLHRIAVAAPPARSSHHASRSSQTGFFGSRDVTPVET